MSVVGSVSLGYSSRVGGVSLPPEKVSVGERRKAESAWFDVKKWSDLVCYRSGVVFAEGFGVWESDSSLERM